MEKHEQETSAGGKRNFDLFTQNDNETNINR